MIRWESSKSIPDSNKAWLDINLCKVDCIRTFDEIVYEAEFGNLDGFKKRTLPDVKEDCSFQSR
jgi:hypothetical protein